MNANGSEAADKFAKILAKYAENAYLPHQAAPEPRTNIISNTLTVQEMHADFILTTRGTLFFSHTTSLMVDVKSGKKEMEDVLQNERRSREAAAAHEASNELVKLVMHAENRGLPIADSFAHFDEKKNGFVDVDLLVSGLAKLGIGLTYPVAESLLQLIGGIGCFFVSLSDFELYIRRNSAGENVKTDMTALSAVSKEEEKSRISEENVSNSGSHLRLPHQRRGAVKAALNSRNALNSASRSVDLTGFDDLPVAESMYTVDVSTSAMTDLPPWASARQRDALREIKKAQRKRKEEDLKAESRSCESVRKSTRQKTSTESPQRSNNEKISDRQSDRPFLTQQGRFRGVKGSALNLQGIAADASSLVSEKLRTEKDEVLHIDSGVVMTFRVVVGTGRDETIKKKHVVDSLRYRGILEDNEKVLIPTEDTSCRANGEDVLIGRSSSCGFQDASTATPANSDKDRLLAFTLFLMPDVFMTLETLHKCFEPLIVKYPMARIIIVGPPGSPFTHWPRGWILNADMQARSILSLLLHLKETNRVGANSDPIFVVGFGTGGYTLSRFISLYLSALAWMQRRLKAVILVNSFVHMSKGFKRVCKDMRSALMLANPAEVAELVSSLHFSDDYLRATDRQTAQTLFWSTRRGLCLINQDDIAQTHLKAGKQYTGVLEQLRGLLIGPDALNSSESFLSSTKIPLFVIQGTDDVFVNPADTSIAYSKTNLEAANRVLVDGVLEGLVPGSLHLSWLKCGHEILIERPQYILALISNFIQEIRTVPDDIKEDDMNQGYRDDFDPVDLARMRREAAVKEQQRITKELQDKIQADEADTLRIKEEKEEIERQRLYFEMELDRNRQAALSAAEEQKRLEEEQRELQAQQQIEKEEAAKKFAKREREKASRLEAMAERKRREAKEARKAELQELYDSQRSFNERKSENYEISRMSIEDERSADLRVYDTECEAAEAAALLARQKLQDLFNCRREDAMKKIEEKMALQRAERLEKRRRDAKGSLQKIEREESAFMDLSKYKLLDPPAIKLDESVLDDDEAAEARISARNDALESIQISRERVAECIATTHNIYRDYMSCRQRLIESMKRQRLVEEKTILFRSQRADLEFEIRKLQRALRLFVKGTLATELGATSFELDELKTSLADKESTFTEFISIGRDKENHLSSANRSVQLLKVAFVSLETVLKQQLSAIQAVENHLSNKSRQLKFTKENLLVARDKHISGKNFVILRLNIVKEEYIRVKAHKEEYVDSDVLFDGVLQRCVTKILRKHLKQERTKWEGRVKEIEAEISACQNRIDDIGEKQIICKLDLDKLSLAIKFFYRGFNRVRQQSIVDDVAEALALQERASNVQQRRDDEQEKMSHAEMIEFLAGKPPTGRASRTRRKPLDLRTKEDRRFIAMDLILHPEEYLDINITEAEEMQFDPDYQCNLKRSDINRIEKLPELIALAMPFLHSKVEVAVHRLINMYYRDRDDSYYEMKDFLSYGEISDGSILAGNSICGSESSSLGVHVALGTADMSHAEVIHEILIKESRRDRIRTMVLNFVV